MRAGSAGTLRLLRAMESDSCAISSCCCCCRSRVRFLLDLRVEMTAYATRAIRRTPATAAPAAMPLTAEGDREELEATLAAMEAAGEREGVAVAVGDSPIVGDTVGDTVDDVVLLGELEGVLDGVYPLEGLAVLELDLVGVREAARAGSTHSAMIKHAITTRAAILPRML